MRIVRFKILLIVFGAFLSVIVCGIVEGGFRIYLLLHGPIQTAPPEPIILAHSKKSTPNAELNPSPYSLPTEVKKRLKFPGKPIIIDTENLDKSQLFPPFIISKGVEHIQPSTKITSICRKKSNNEIIYMKSLSSDALGRRYTPPPDQNARPKHIIFFGDSFVAGEGVNDNETLPYYTARATKKYLAYNLGMSGGSINDAWAFFNVLDLARDIQNKDGLALYVFIEDHIYRFIGKMNYQLGWLENRPYVRADRNGKVHFSGLWREVEPLWVVLSKFLSGSYLLRSINFNPPSVSPLHLRQFAQVVASLRDSYQKKMGATNPFYFVFYFDYSNKYAPLLRPYLDEFKIHYIDYSKVKLSRLTDKPVYYDTDGHPTDTAHQVVGELLAHDLNLE